MKTPRRRQTSRAPQAARPTDLRTQERLRDIDLAAARIGATAGARLRWLLAFAERDLDHEPLSSSEWVTLGDELLAIVRPGQAASDFLPQPTAADLRQLRAALKAALDSYLRDGILPLPAMPEVAHRVQAPGDVVVTERSRMFTLRDVISQGNGAALEAMLLHHFVTVMETSRPYPRRCPECGKLLVPRRRQLRHPKCSQRRRDLTRKKKRQEQRAGAGRSGIRPVLEKPRDAQRLGRQKKGT